MQQAFKISAVKRCVAVAALLFASISAQAEEKKPLTVFAAASLGHALEAALESFDHPVRVSLGGSGAIARQVAQGAPADVVFLANPRWMGWLDDQGLLRAGTRTSPIGNVLAVVGPSGATPLPDLSLQTLLDRLGKDGRIAVGEVRSVPAGQYAKAWLNRAGLWPDIRPRLAEVENVRAALALVARGEVPLAILYATDLAAAQDTVTEVWNIAADAQPDIRYELASLSDEGDELASFLASADARTVFQGFGFTEAAR